MRFALALSGIFLLLSGVTGRVAAGVIVLASPAQLDPTNVTFIYPQPELTVVPSPYVVNFSGTTLTFTNMDGDFSRQDQGIFFPGNFPNGTPLLHNGPGNAGGPSTITFAPGVAEVGLGVQSETPGMHTFTITAYNGLTPLTSYMLPGNGFVTFIGLRATGGDLITSLTISSDDNDFAMGPVTFSAAVVPEPGSFALLGLALLATAGARSARRKLGFPGPST